MDVDYGIAMIVDKVVIIASKAHVQKQPLLPRKLIPPVQKDPCLQPGS